MLGENICDVVVALFGLWGHRTNPTCGDTNPAGHCRTTIGNAGDGDDSSERANWIGCRCDGDLAPVSG